MVLLLLSLLHAAAASSTATTAWMAPQSFRLVIGMPRDEAVATLEDAGWTVKTGRNPEEMVVDYGEDKALTLEFRRERLRSIRFELFALLPEIRKAFSEQKELLRKAHGDPKNGSRSRTVVVYDDRLPNIIVVLSDDPGSDYGKKGVGYLAVRYFDPVQKE